VAKKRFVLGKVGMKMEINEMIGKWRMQLAEKDGQPGVMLHGKATAKQKAMIIAAKPEIIAELQRREAEKVARRAKEQAEREAEKQAILAGGKNITIEYHDGEYLMGYQVYGQAAELLVNLGLAKWVDGWGYHVASHAVKALGEEFTYQQAVECARPAIEAKEAAKAKREAERQAKFDEARETEKPVLLRKWSSDCHDPREECSMDINAEYAMPDGSVKHEWHHTW
jgi:hypothetical protein